MRFGRDPHADRPLADLGDRVHEVRLQAVQRPRERQRRGEIELREQRGRRNADGGNIWYARFDASNEWVYFVQEHLAQGPQLYRSRVASGAPEPAQRVNPDDLETDYTYLAGFSPDGTKAVYGTSVDSVTNLWLVDVAGDVPGESALLHGELSQTPSPPLAWSIDSRHVAYRLDPGGLENQSIALTDTVDGVGTYVEIAELARVYGTQYVELSSTAALPR
jgi:hypothetical protein